MDYTDESLQLTITEAIYATDVGLSLGKLFKQLFGVNDYDKVSNTLKTFVRRHYINQLKGFVRHFGKKHIYEQLKAGSTVFIKRFEQQKALHNLFNDVARVQLRINCLLEENSEGSLFTEFSRYFIRLRNRFVPIQAEETFRLALIEWFKSGEMTKMIRSELNSWFQNGATLNKFKQMSLSVATNRDSHNVKVIKAVQQISTDEFMKLEDLKGLLSKFLAPTVINGKGKKVELRGRTIFLSDCIIDIVENPGKSKAASAQNYFEHGSDGTDGLPGYSSGNCCLYAKEMVNPSWLSVYLNGGRGQDGGDGGDGYNGKDGIGITQNELDTLCVKYSSLYFNWWSTFQGYSPPSNWKQKYRNWNSSTQFGYAEYQDEHGRIIKYSFAGDVGWVYTTYHLYFMVVGSAGTAGTQGGRNGVGGEGGYRGICKAENPETGESFSINIERNMGQNGIDGLVGKSGRCGVNGNHMALIDRSLTGGEKHYIGSSTTELSTSFDYEAQTYNRLNGDRKHVEKKSACFARFSTTQVDTTERKAHAPVQRNERSRASKAIAKKHVITEEVLSRAEEFFEAENAFLADACKQTAASHHNDEEVDEEKEAAENVSEEMVMLRQRDESQIIKYIPESEKKSRPKITPQNLIQRIRATGRFGTIGSAAQNIFDLFEIEISSLLLETVRFHILFQKNHFYHCVMDSKLSLALIAAQQDRLVNGKNFNDIVAIAKDITTRRRQKFAYARFSANLKKFVNDFEKVESVPNLSIDIGAEKLEGVKKANYEVHPDSVTKEINDFFCDFLKYRVQQDLLTLLHDFYKGVNEKYVAMLRSFNEQIDWTDKKSFEAYFNMLQAWHKEDENRKKAMEANTEDDMEEVLPKLRDQTTLETQFEVFMTTLHKENKLWADLLNALRHYIKGNKELIARFGEVPVFSEKKSLRQKVTSVFSNKSTSSFIEQSLYVIRLYWLSFRILTYMRHLYNCNELFAIETGKIRHNDVYTDDGNDPAFDHFIHRAQTRSLDVANEACQLYMEKNGMYCASVRYLMAYRCDINYQSYVESGYYELSKKENFNSTAKKIHLLWIDKQKVHRIIVSEDYRDLIQSQIKMMEKYPYTLEIELDTDSERDYRLSSVRQKFTSFYAKPFQNAIMQWIEGYLVVTNDQTFLHHLNNRFYIDGCHLTPFELQFILLSAAKWQTNYRCPIKFLLLISSSVSQGELINIFLYISIIYYQGYRFHDTKIYHGIQLIENVRHKALFAVKLNEYEEPIDTDQMYKLILMLQHSSDGSEQLENMTLYEWIDIANRQKWSEIGVLIKKYGDVGYYLGFLDDHGRTDEEERMRDVFECVQYIPEILIAKISQLIVNGEVNANKDYFNTLLLLLKLGNDFPDLKVISDKRPYLITHELVQQKFMKFIKQRNPGAYLTILPNNKRTVDEMIELVTGLHDATKESKEARKTETLQNSNKTDETLPISMRLLLEYDDYLYELHQLRLRPTQRMAVLYAVESGKNVLEQVNTGEGKSYIIAAIAIIRCKIGHKHVDIITSSPVLAQRDADDMRSLYAKFELTVGHNCDEDVEQRKKAYESHIVYGDIARFQRDYLLHTFYKKNVLGDRTRDAVVVDEVDNMLLDNGNNMLYLSHNVVGLNLLDSLLIFIQKQIYLPIFSGIKNDLESTQIQFEDRKIKQAVMQDIYGQLTLSDLMKLKSHKMTKKDVEEAFNKLIQNELIDVDGYLKITNVDQLSPLKNRFSDDQVFLVRLKNTFRIILDRQRTINLPKCLRDFVQLHLDELIKSSKNAMFMKNDHEYVVDVDHNGGSSFIEPRITIIDANTGADLATSQWSGGLHQFLQIKHGCRLSPISLKAVFVSNVAYLKGYEKINGLSGTLGSEHESRTLIELYDADLVKIPTFKPKIFYEHVPVIATNETDWLQNLFDEVCDQVNAKRSVLIICESISHLRMVKSELESQYRQQTKPTKEIKTCFESIIMYEREFNKFKFGVGSELQCSKLIIATNLAGRGTDIKLSCELIEARGLHVITAFLPVNCRIEEQAFGRAARAGEPGSAQIIAMRATDDGIQSSVFQLKMFRDNQEVHRLASLASFYKFHTETEEKCLEKFRHHCKEALSIIYSSKYTNTPDVLPTPAQVVYFALLDKWALWLDQNALLINHCAKNHSQKEKEAIIASVDGFLHAHPIDDAKNSHEEKEAIIASIDGFLHAHPTDDAKNFQEEKEAIIASIDGFLHAHPTDDAKNFQEEREAIIASVTDLLNANPIHDAKNCYEVAKEWIDFPQSLITLGIIQMSHDNGFQAAEDTFKRILGDGYEFAAEVYYFKACMRMCQWTKTRRTLDSIKITPGENFPENIEYAIEYFRKSRALFTERVQRRQREAQIVMEFLDASASNHIKTCGFAEQQKAIISTYELIIANIEWILGIPCRSDMFVTEGIPKDYANEIYESFVRQGVISPIRISKYELENWQINPLRHNFKLSHKNIVQLIDEIKNDARSETFDDDIVLDANIMAAHVNLSYRIDFWMQLKRLNVFVHAKETEKDDKELELEERIKHVLLVDSDFKDKLPTWMTQLKPIPEFDLETLRYQVRLSNETEHGLMYDYSDITALKNKNNITEIEELVKSKVIRHDWIGQINVKVLRHIEYFDSFDGVTTTDIADFFNIDVVSAAWIIDLLIENGVLKRHTMEMHQLTQDEQLWKEKVEVYVNKEITDKANLIAKHADNLIKIRNLPILKNITPGIIAHYCKFTDNDQLLTFFKLLKDENLLIPFFFTKFRLYGKLDCSCLPSSIANEIDAFLSDRFAYSFALEHLCIALDKSIYDPKTPKNLFLKENPQDELYEELISFGIGEQSCISQEDYLFLDFDQFKYKDELIAVINTHRTKLWDQTHYHMEFVPFASYFTTQGYTIDSDTKAIIENGLLMVISKKNESIGWTLQNFVIKNVVEISKTMWSKVKAVGNFFYSIGSGICSFVSPFIEHCVDAFDYAAECGIAAGRAIKAEVMKVVDVIAESEIVKIATQTVMDITSVIGEQIVNAAQAVRDTIVTVADQTGITAATKAVGIVATTVGTVLAETTVAVTTTIVNTATDVGEYIASTKVFTLAKQAFNDAMNTANNVYKKMSAYVTAAAESYSYYNQCRFAARRLAIEQRGIIDEHFILQSYDKAMSSENRVEENDSIFEQKMRDYMLQSALSWMSQAKSIISTIAEKHFANIHNSLSYTDIQAVVEGGRAISKLKTEATEHLVVLANITKVVFFQVIKHYAVQRNTNLTTLSLSELGLSQTKHNFDQLAESIKMICEEIQETVENNNPNVYSSNDLIINVQNILQEKLKTLVDSVFIDPTIKLTSAFLESCRNHPQLATMSAFSKEDTALKKAISDFNASTQNKKNAEFLLHQLHKVVIDMLTSHPNDKELLKFAIKFGFPLPLAAMKPIASTVHSIFSKNNYSTGFWLLAYAEDADFEKNQPILKYATADTAKMQIKLRCVNDQLFICRTDFMKYSGSDDINGCFFYESLMEKMKHLKKCFPNHELSFRELLIQYI
ncbi:unnamed protein product [Adineta steineri]|uniref:Protein translocase subunit SecA n=1 Tax=Adineta steineri TaxID=433720 RepID=A0A819N4V7_9BILA|nr:unnamed protein product [Adineta steineri]